MKWKYVGKPEEEWLGTKLRENKGEKDNPEGGPAVVGEKPFTHEHHTATT
jgi:Mn-containing catalase